MILGIDYTYLMLAYLFLCTYYGGVAIGIGIGSEETKGHPMLSHLLVFIIFFVGWPMLMCLKPPKGN